MPRGSQDYGQYAQQSLVSRGIDTNELAVRLGNVSAFIRAGNMLYCCDFTKGLLSMAVTDSVGGYNNISIAKPFLSPYSLKIYNPVTPDGLAFIHVFLPFQDATTYGVEVAVEKFANECHFIISLIIYDGGYECYSALRYHPEGGGLEYLDSAGVWQDLGPVSNLAGYQWAFAVMKLTIDAEKSYYKSFQVNQEIIDLSKYAMMKTINTTAPYMHTGFEIFNNQVAPDPYYIGHYIVTQNDP